MKECWIIGAGISGIAAAWTLHSTGQYKPIFLEKSRGVGGRMSTRRTDQGNFDHGAQFFKVREQEFINFLDLAFRNDLIKTWCDQIPSEQQKESVPEKIYCGQNGMSSIAKFYQSHYNWKLHTREKIIRLEAQGDGVNLVTEENTFSASRVIFTAPVPQVLDILNNSNVTIPQDQQQKLNFVEYDPCFALLLVLDRPSSLAKPGALEVNTSPFGWIADNHQKGITNAYTVTIHADIEFSKQYLEADLEEVKSILLKEITPYISEKILHSQIHRWRYSRIHKSYPDKYCHLNTLGSFYLAGDSFGHANIESAALSGIAAANQLIVNDQ